MRDCNQTANILSNLNSVITIPEFIAILISIVSAIFALWSWNESKKANAISIHPKQLEVYDAFNELIMYVSINGTRLELEEVAKFYKFSQKAEFYFDKKFANQLNEYFEVCRKLAHLNRKYLRDYNEDEKVKRVHQEQDVLFDIEIELSNKIKKEFKYILKI